MRKKRVNVGYQYSSFDKFFVESASKTKKIVTLTSESLMIGICSYGQI